MDSSSKRKSSLPSAPRFPSSAILLGLAIIFLVLTWMQGGRSTNTIAYSDFLADLEQGKIAEVSIGRDRILGDFKNPVKGKPEYFSAYKVDDPSLTQRLTRAGVKFTGTDTGSVLSSLLSWVFPLLLFYLMWTYFFRKAGMGGPGGGGGLLSLGKSKAKVYLETHLKTRFDDVAGVDEAKEELKEIVSFLRDPVAYSRLGGRMPKGILLVGPPGTGKTLLARAVAGEANVPFFSINGSEFVELFVGLGAARVRDLFVQARSEAPCIIFIDELDALGKARGISAITGAANDEKEQTLNQLLAEMDGFDPSQGIILLAATNRPEVLDPALLRAGRFDRQILVDRPDRAGREKILLIHLRKITLAPAVDIPALASMTAGFSGADLSNLANEAALIATRRGALSVELRDFTEAIERIVAGLERKNRLLNAEEKRRVAYHEMGHALMALALGQGEVVHKVSIIPRGISALGYTLRRPTEDRYLMSRSELQNKMAILLGGRAAEQLFFEDISTGAGDDLDKATDIARAMVTRYGMDSGLGLAVFEREPSPMLGGQIPVRTFEYSEKTGQIIDAAVENLLDHGLSVAVRTIEQRREFVEEAAQILLQKETIDEEGLKALWNKHSRSRPSLIYEPPRQAV